MATTPNMGLTTWPNLSDVFSHTALANSLNKIDVHDHTSTKGVKVGVGGLANLTVGSAQLQDGAVLTSKIGDSQVTTAKISSSLSTFIRPAGASPYFRAYRSSAVGYASGATVVCNSETDPNNWYNTTTGIFLPTVAGTYRFSWRVSLVSTLTAGKYLYGAVTNNGGLVIDQDVAGQVGSTVAPMVGGSGIVSLNGTTGSLKMILVHDNGGNVAVNYSSDPGVTHFEAEYVGV